MNYDKIISLQPFVYESSHNALGQNFELLEHPIKGDSSPVLVHFPDDKKLFESDFYDCGDMLTDEYSPLLIDGVLKYAYEIIN
jgi:hypothetical protein